MIIEDVLITLEDRTIVVDDIDAAARRILHANSVAIEAATFPQRKPPFHTDRFQVLVPAGTVMAGGDTIMAPQWLTFPSGDSIRLVPEEFIVKLREGR